MSLISRILVLLKRLIILAGSVAAIYFLYLYVLPDVYRRTNFLVAIILLWLVTAYVVLPRIHRLLSRIYVPNHFIGRSRTADGLLSDPVNIGLIGSKHDLISAMEAAGWQVADDLSPGSVWRLIKSVVLRRSYPTAPVSDAFLFGKRHAVAFQKEVNNNPHKRHHVRFWRTPANWYLPGGHQVDWLGSATLDESVKLSLFTSQFTHRIDSHVNREREFLVDSLQSSRQIKHVQHVEHVFGSYRARNGFGDFYRSDGSVVVAELKAAQR